MKQKEKYLDLFLENLLIHRNYSEHTIRNYQIDLKEFLEKTGYAELKELDYPFLRAYVARLRDKKYRSRTIARKVSSLKGFFNFLYKEGHLDKNPASLLVSPKLEKILPKPGLFL